MSDDPAYENGYNDAKAEAATEIKRLQAAILDHKAETIGYCGDNHDDYAPWDLELWTAAAPTEEPSDE